MVKTGASVALQFLVSDANGALSNADALPTGTLVKNAAATADVVTVANVTTGVYSASVTMPTLAAGDIMQIRVAATIGGVTTGGLIWRDDADTKYISENNAPTADQNADALLDRANAIDTGLTPRHALELAAGAIVNKLSGAGTATETRRNFSDTANLATLTVDGSGNVTAVVYDFSI